MSMSAEEMANKIEMLQQYWDDVGFREFENALYHRRDLCNQYEQPFTESLVRLHMSLEDKDASVIQRAKIQTAKEIIEEMKANNELPAC